jgi:hypothetical protein
VCAGVRTRSVRPDTGMARLLVHNMCMSEFAYILHEFMCTCIHELITYLCFYLNICAHARTRKINTNALA